jgi:uncharacterized protein YjiS (DUF1127 family)
MTTTATRSSDFFHAAFETLAGPVRSFHSRRSQRLSLESLLDMDPHRLRDLGLNDYDVRNALEGRLHRG